MTARWMRLAGRLIAIGVRLTERNGRGASKAVPGRQSRTRVVQVIQQDGLLFARLQSLQHSLWRSMELNAVLSARAYLREPLLDLGCGNGLFFSLISPHAEAGVDLDMQTLRACPHGLYTCVAVADASAGLPFPSNHFACIFANSVIEHVTAMESLLREVARTLQAGGIFLFTVPGDRFLTHLSDFFGPDDARRMNEQMNHVHLLSSAEWAAILAGQNLEVVESRPYFPADAVFWWRAMATRVFMRLERPLAGLLWGILAHRLLRLTRAGVQEMPEGAGLLVIARKSLG